MSTRPWVNYHHLLYFKTIAQEGGIARAAKRLKLGQPTLSTQLKQFESVLGHELFERKQRKLHLTEAGRMVLDYASEIFKLGDEMIDSLNDHHAHENIHVQIGVIDAVPKHLSLKLIQFARQKFGCSVTITSGGSHELMRELRAHNLDLLVTNEDPRSGDSPGIFPKRIAKMNVIVCGGRKYLYLKKGFPQSLKGVSFVMPGLTTKLRHELDHYFRQSNVHVQSLGDVHDTALQKLLAVQGEGVIAMAAPALEELLANGELMEIGTLHDVYEELWLVSAQRKIQNPVAATIMKEFSI